MNGVLAFTLLVSGEVATCPIDSEVVDSEVVDNRVNGARVEVIKAAINTQLRISALELQSLFNPNSTKINELPMTTWCNANVVNNVY
jgi:hypothetical protein